MKKHFVITGLPRSRTAWLSAFFTTGDIFCYHEALKGCTAENDYLVKMEAPRQPIVGDSDCALSVAPIRTLFGKSPVVIIERDSEEVIQSLIDMGFKDKKKVEEIVKIAEKALSQVDADLRVSFYDINAALPDIWRICVGNSYPYDSLRASEFINLDIQTTDFEVF